MRRKAHSTSGYTLIELLVGMGIAAILMATALWQVNTRRENTNTFTSAMLADVRLARALAITGGTHYCLHKYGSGYQVRRLKKVGNSWYMEKVVKTVTLPAGITWSMWPMHVRFNTRGMGIDGNDQAIDITIHDQFGAERLVTVWPSGQAYEQS